MSRSIPLLAILTISSACARDASVSPERAPEPAAPKLASAAEALDSMDGRTALPLLPMMANHQKQNMRDHLLAVQEIVAALASDDFAAVERAAGRIGFSQQMGQMCTHMGAGAPGFTEQALHFHHTADGIAEAARARDHGRVLEALSSTLQTCTACHATWKQQVVDETAWQSLTSSSAQGHAMPH